jgi:hypothetical protein
MNDYHTDRAAAQLEHATIAFLEKNGTTLNKHGNLLGAKIADAADGIIFDLSRYVGQPQSADDVVALADDVPLDEAAVLFIAGALAGEHDQFNDGCAETSDSVTHAEDLEDTETVALRALTKRNKTRETLRVRDLASNREFTDAVMMGDFHKANEMMRDVVRDTGAPYALRVACIGAMIQIAKYVGTDDGGKFNDAWLSRTTGIARSTCKELIDAQRAVGTDLAMLLLGTASEDRKGVREWGAMLPDRQSIAVEGLKQFHTAQMIAHAGECEDVVRARKISLSEADVLDAVGMNNREGREQLVKMPVKAGQLWLASMLDETNEAATRTGGIVATGKSAADSEKSKLVKPLSPAVPTKRLLTQRQLNANNVYELGDPVG